MITRDDLQLMKERLSNLSLELLPQIVLKDFPRLIREVEALQAMVFIQQFNGGISSESNEHEASDAGVQPEGVVSETSSEPVPSEHTDDAEGTEEAKPVRATPQGQASQRRRNRKRRRKGKG